jgi:hypothetical protein
MGVNGWDYGVGLDLHCIDQSWVEVKRYRRLDIIGRMYGTGRFDLTSDGMNWNRNEGLYLSHCS